jgi:hypothetical protein
MGLTILSTASRVKFPAKRSENIPDSGPSPSFSTIDGPGTAPAQHRCFPSSRALGRSKRRSIGRLDGQKCFRHQASPGFHLPSWSHHLRRLCVSSTQPRASCPPPAAPLSRAESCCKWSCCCQRHSLSWSPHISSPVISLGFFKTSRRLCSTPIRPTHDRVASLCSRAFVTEPTTTVTHSNPARQNSEPPASRKPIAAT